MSSCAAFLTTGFLALLRPSDYIYIYIDDIVEATLRLIDRPQDGGTYNLGSGVGYSVNQVKDVVEQVCGRTLHATYRPARGADARRVELDNTRLSVGLGWQPVVGLVDGVARTWERVQQELPDNGHRLENLIDGL